jgi:mannosyltransferase
MSTITTRKFNLGSPALYLSALVAVAILLSLFVWMGESLRLDEAQSVWQTSRSLPGVIDTVAKDVHMPLYFIGLHFWELMFGTGEFAIRFFSLIFFALSIPALFYLAKDAYGERAAYWSALFAAASPFLNWYGSEARMYSLLFLMTALSHLLFIRLWKMPERRTWGLYGLITVLGVFTHVFFVFIPIVQIAFYLTHRSIFSPSDWRPLRKVILATGALGVLWFIYRVIAGAGLSEPVLAPPSSFDFFNVFSNFFLGFQTDAVNTFYLSLWPLLVFVGFTFLTRKRQSEPETAYLILASIIPIVLTFAFSLTFQPVFLSRYLVVALPSLYVLVAHFLSSYKSRAADISLFVVAALMASMLFVQAVSSQSPVKEDYRSAALYVEERAKANDLFVVSAPFLTYPIEYYYRGPSDLATFPRWDRYVKDTLPAAYSESLIEESAREWARSYRDVYLLLGYDQGYEEDVRLYMDTHFERIDMKTFSPGLTLYVYRLKYI